jgi:hypothetical protein
VDLNINETVNEKEMREREKIGSFIKQLKAIVLNSIRFDILTELFPHL